MSPAPIIDLNAPPSALSQAIAPLVETPAPVLVTDATTYTAALEYVRDGKRRCQQVIETLRPAKSNAHAAWKAICALETNAVTRIERAYTPVERAALDWKREQDRLVEQARQRAIAEARQLEEARLAAEAAALERAGDADRAAAVLEQAIEQPTMTYAPPPLMPVAPKVEGITTTQSWKFEVVNAALVPREYLSVDEKKIGAVVRALKGATKIPGVRVYPDESTRNTGGRR